MLSRDIRNGDVTMAHTFSSSLLLGSPLSSGFCTCMRQQEYQRNQMRQVCKLLVLWMARTFVLLLLDHLRLHQKLLDQAADRYLASHGKKQSF